MNCVVYARVSTEKQAEKELSIPAQIQACRDYAKRQSWSVIEEYLEPGVSAKTASRPILQQMLSACRSTTPKVDVVLVHKIDRLARNVEDHVGIRAVLHRHNVKLASVVENLDESVSGRLVENIMASIAQFYSANLGEEVKKGMRQKVQRGGWPHHPARGYRVVEGQNGQKEIQIDPVLGPLVQKAFQLYATGWYSLKDLGRILAQEGLCTKQGKPIPVSYLRKLLENPFYIGRVRWEGKDHSGNHPPLISEELFQKAIETKLARASDTGEKGRLRFLLRGVALCAECGRRVTAERHGRWSYYRCIGNTVSRHQCRAKFSNVKTTHENLVGLYQKLQLPHTLREQLRRESTDAIKRQIYSARQRLASLKLRKTKLHDREIQLAEGFVSGGVHAGVYKTLAAKMRLELAGIEKALKDAELDPKAMEEKVDRTLDKAGSLWDLHRSFDERNQQRLAREVFSAIILDEGAIVGYTLKPPFDQLLKPPRSSAGRAGSSDRGDSSPHLELTALTSTIQSILEVESAVVRAGQKPPT